MFSVVVCALLLSPSLPAVAPPVIAAVRDKDDVPGVNAVFDVDAAPDDLLQMLWDVSKFREIFPDIKELVVESQPDERTVVVRFGIDAVVTKVGYTLRREIDRDARTIRWVSVAGDLKKIVGFWKIEAGAAGGSHVTYQSIVDVGWVPGAASAYRSIVLSKMDEVVGRVRTAAAKLPKHPT